MDHEFDMQKRKKGDVVVLDLAGSLTVGANEQVFKETITDLVSRKHNRIVVNLDAVEFMDSSGIGALVKSYTTITQNGGKLKLLQPNKMIRHTLKITGLLGIFEIFEDEAAAIASF
ncbi:STAS domain-containing protein [bacterium]|nr:STAS domain-containing protein [bacterium]MCI0603300.1 STAS domain-containing protein [bacterium]